MSELTLDDVEKGKATRDESGELLPNEHTIEWHGEEKTVKVRPITTGFLNRMGSEEQGLQELDPSSLAKVFKAAYVQPDFSGWDAKDVKDLTPETLNALLTPIENEMPEGAVGNPETNPRS